MGLISNFFSGYAHGSNKAAQARIEKKIDNLSKKIDSSQSTPSSESKPIKSHNTKNDSYNVYMNCYDAYRRDGLSHDGASNKARIEEACYNHNKNNHRK